MQRRVIGHVDVSLILLKGADQRIGQSMSPDALTEGRRMSTTSPPTRLVTPRSISCVVCSFVPHEKSCTGGEVTLAPGPHRNSALDSRLEKAKMLSRLM